MFHIYWKISSPYPPQWTMEELNKGMNVFYFLFLVLIRLHIHTHYLSLSLSLSLTHTHTPSHTRILYIHTHTHTHTHTHKYKLTNLCIRATLLRHEAYMAQSLPITDSTFSCNSIAASKASLYWPASKQIHIKYLEKSNINIYSNSNK